MVKQLAIRNLKRSIQDYRIYLFTFTFSITIVYLFQSLVNQQTSIALSQNQLGLMNTILRALEGVNIFVVIAFSALLAGANGFLLKRRQQEFAIYYALGMKQHQVAQLLALETFGTGAIALILGIILGVAISQIMILMTAQLFQTTVINYQFLFSWIAILKTSVYFLIIIIGIFLLNYWQLKRYRITSLLKNKQKTYELKRVLQQRLVLEWSGATLLILSGYFFLQSTWFSKYFFVSIIVSLCMILTCIWLNITSVKL
ncbi:MAG: FtsX-like permease family protein, partial [Culicoidibacterales bacterium]